MFSEDEQRRIADREAARRSLSAKQEESFIETQARERGRAERAAAREAEDAAYEELLPRMVAGETVDRLLATWEAKGRPLLEIAVGAEVYDLGKFLKGSRVQPSDLLRIEALLED
jgi:hypothetical protein